ncbi:LOW QUALITY PROTEIN: uncharacterized protein MICPUCDRAFT_69546 [Micromonas pusilla CCMP1545]|uniref:26S proteasome complex subunit SEM1 n=1 Tax=Micromonas pusilla (strain CCMP1545) TaxID=564608 RepID=C1MUE9_MICPC|nr:LOW QUALITY PROTEIN: uncharacterized protein MICPUCDRAFT_69546 [Micromonas pusilla CCMP1545]EEH56616.1 predicted protein [Micromonas pusilla CCMP1545]|eukprot:XP_003059484.1 predicted protein [Micromonas pusilla CCMP1545]
MSPRRVRGGAIAMSPIGASCLRAETARGDARGRVLSRGVVCPRREDAFPRPAFLSTVVFSDRPMSSSSISSRRRRPRTSLHRANARADEDGGRKERRAEEGRRGRPRVRRRVRGVRERRCAPPGEPASTSRARARSDLKKSAPAARSHLLRAHQNLSPLAPFVVAEWANEDEDAEDVQQWEEDWDDSDANDDFTKQLRAELDRFEQTKQ